MPRLGSVLVRIAIIALATVLILETVLQFAFLELPQILIEQMPQYLERSGFRLQTEHGAREYPAGQSVDYMVHQTSGDLYRLTCLAPASAPPFVSYQVRFTRDSRGFRNEEPWPAKVDIVILGDSYVAAEAIAEPFWQLVAKSMLVLGLPGSGTLEQQRLYEAFAAPRKPNTVVLAYFSGNDLADNRDFAAMQRSGETFSDKAHKGKHLLDYAVLFNLALYIGRAFSADSNACHYPQEAATVPPTPLAFYDSFLVSLAGEAETFDESEAFRLTKESIAAMSADQLSHGRRFILMYIPQKAELYWTLLSALGRNTILAQLVEDHAITEIDGMVANLLTQRDHLAALAVDLGIEFLDLTGPLSTAIADGLQPYFYADTHWNHTGHNIARNALLDQLNQTNLDT